jgi:hypothetical protein
MKAYNMLNQRASTFSKLPPVWGQRLTPSPDLFASQKVPDSKAGDSGNGNA